MIKKTLSALAVTIMVLGIFTSLNQDKSVEAQSVDEIEQELKEIEQEKKKINSELNSLKEKMNKVQSEKKDAKSKLDNIKYQIQTTEAKIDLKENEIAQTETEIRALEQEINNLIGEINKLEEEISKLEEEIKQLEQEIKETEKRIKKREEILIERLRTLQRNGGSVKYLEVIMGAKDFGEFISRTTAVSKIMEQDESILTNHFADKEKLEEDKRTVEENKQIVEESKQAIVSKKEEVEKSKEQTEAKRNQLVAKRNELNSLVANLDEKKQEQQVVLASIQEKEDHLHSIQLSAQEEMQLAREREKHLEQAKKAANSTGFITPAAGRLTSHFNPNRLDPVYGIPKAHNGMDIANGVGTPIKSAAGGVVFKTYSHCSRGHTSCGGGFGNAVFVTHYVNGQQYDTIYAHLSSVNVSPGQTVSAGQVIGGMGSTGASTGSHLHFEIHPGGYKNPVNPLNYVAAP